MAAVDIIITLAIIIKIIDIFVVSYKKKNKEKAIKADTKKTRQNTYNNHDHNYNYVDRRRCKKSKN